MCFVSSSSSSSEFAKEKDRVESRAGFLHTKEEQKLEREMRGYMDWICRAGQSPYTSGRCSTSLQVEAYRVRQKNFDWLSCPSLCNELSLTSLKLEDRLVKARFFK